LALDSEPIRILIVDDEKSIRDGSERVLKRMGFNVYLASRGDEVPEILAREKPAIVLLDMKLPGMSGMEVLGHIRKEEPSVIVIVITGFATIETAIEAMKNGAYDFIPKPFEPDQLRIVVNRARETLRLTWEREQLEKERRRTLADLDTEKSRLHTILNSLPNAVVVTNTGGRVVLMNPAFGNLLDLDPCLNAGQSIETYVPDEGFCTLVKKISSGKFVDFEDIPTYEFNHGSQKFLLAKGRPVIGERNECLGAVVNLMDITSMRMMDQMKTEFVAKVTHELRSPLSTIHAQLTTAIKEMMAGDAGKDHQLLARAKDKTQGLISLIGDLLDLSRIEAGTASLASKPVQLDELLKDIVDFLTAQARVKEQRLDMVLPSEPMPAIHTDPMVLESIFGNLITNAIKYTPNKGRITVTAEFTGKQYRVSVADNGYGIDPKHLKKIFERFYRVKNDNTRFIIGTGLGLPIVNGLVNALGGSINVESTPNEGSMFTVFLPTERSCEVPI
jgi:signal transduction histidine kinase/FixJ family two-component response regulator